MSVVGRRVHDWMVCVSGWCVWLGGLCGWMVCVAGWCVPGFMSDTILPMPSDVGGVAVELASYVVGDGNKGIAEAFKRWL